MTFTASRCFSSHHHHRCRRHLQNSDPSSPKVGCFGQVRRPNPPEKSEAPPLPPLPPPPHSSNHQFYFLMAPLAFFASPTNCKKRGKTFRRSRVVAVEEIDRPSPVDVEEMDPPLPVTAFEKKETATEAPEMSLWKRRCRSRKLDELFFCRREKLPVPIAGLVV